MSYSAASKVSLTAAALLDGAYTTALLKCAIYSLLFSVIIDKRNISYMAVII